MVRTAAGFTLLVAMLAFFAIASLFVAAPRLVRPVKALARTMLRTFGIRVRVTGLEHLDPDATYLYTSNHVGLLDHFVVLGHLPGYVVGLEKAENGKIPLYGWVGKRWGQVRIDRTSVWTSLESYQTVIDRLGAGIGVIMYPEGHRSLDGRLLTFKPALFQMAVESNATVVPIVLSGLQRLYPRGAKLVGSGVVELRVLAPIPPVSGPNARDELATSVRAAMLDALGQTDDSPPWSEEAHDGRV